MLPPALFTPDEAKLLHAQGFNALFASVDEMSRRDEKPPGASLWMLADDTGFFVLGSSSDPLQFVGLRHEIASYPSNFGWVFNRAQLPTAPPAEDRLDMFYGVNTSTPSHLDNVHFLVCHDHELGWLAEVELPKIVVAKRIPDPLPARADVIGWISAPTT
jgi:hypothetical protein